jgi:3-methyladenine DNA glycosylase Tag
MAEKSDEFAGRMRWNGPRPTNYECLQACIANAERAAALQAGALAEYMRAPKGTEDADNAHWDYAKHAADQKHWREMANWYRDEIAREGEMTKLAQKRADDEKAPSAQAELGGGLR